jgi:hypothetical protein
MWHSKQNRQVIKQKTAAPQGGHFQKKLTDVFDAVRHRSRRNINVHFITLLLTQERLANR